MQSECVSAWEDNDKRYQSVMASVSGHFGDQESSRTNASRPEKAVLAPEDIALKVTSPLATHIVRAGCLAARLRLFGHRAQGQATHQIALDV